MIRLSKKSLSSDKNDDFSELYSQDGFIHIAGMRFSATNGFKWYLDGCINGNHSDSVKQLQVSLISKIHTGLHAEAKKHKGYVGSGHFPEFDSKINLLKFAKHLQDLLDY